MAIETSLTAPIRIGTFYMQADGNPDIHYTLSCVELLDCPYGVQILSHGPHYINDPESPYHQQYVVRYSFEYLGGGPVPGAIVRTHFLEPFLPQKGVHGEQIVPAAVEVYNAADPTQKKVGEVNTHNPTRRDKIPLEHAETAQGPAVVYPLWQPRTAVFVNPPLSEGDPSDPRFYATFVIAKTTNPNNRRLTVGTNYAGGDTLPVFPDTTTPFNGIDYYASVLFYNTGKDQFQWVLCQATQSQEPVDWDNPLEFDIPMTSES